jgi:hypothetical protein
MNTIQIDTVDGPVNYTELDVKRFIEKAGQLSDVKYKVRDFFSEREWEDSKTTVTRSEINELFSAIGVDHLRGKYKATLTITAYINDYPAQDEDDAIQSLEDDVEINVGSSATITVDRIEVDDVEEDD